MLHRPGNYTFFSIKCITRDHHAKQKNCTEYTSIAIESVTHSMAILTHLVKCRHNATPFHIAHGWQTLQMHGFL